MINRDLTSINFVNKLLRELFFGKSSYFFLPAIFLLILGSGNFFVGTLKKEQYSKVKQSLNENELLPLKEISPIVRLQNLEESKKISIERLRIVNQRIDLYQFVIFIGRVFVATSILLLLISLYYIKFYRFN